MNKNTLVSAVFYDQLLRHIQANDYEGFRTVFLKLHIKDQYDLFQALYPEMKGKVDYLLSAEEFAPIFEWMVIDEQEDVFPMFSTIEYDLVALPIVDEDRSLQGIVTVDDVIDVLEAEITEDFQEFAAISNAEEKPSHVWAIARQRIPWIIILLFMGMISANLINSFEETLSQVVILAAFIPIIMDAAGNVGTQSLAVAVRKITLKNQSESIIKTLIVEFIVGLIIGSSAGIVIALTVLIIYQNMALAVILGLTLLITLSLSTVVGAFIPYLTHKMNFDAAIASGPFITTINDIMGLYLYFSIASMLLHLI